MPRCDNHNWNVIKNSNREICTKRIRRGLSDQLTREIILCVRCRCRETGPIVSVHYKLRRDTANDPKAKWKANGFTEWNEWIIRIGHAVLVGFSRHISLIKNSRCERMFTENKFLNSIPVEEKHSRIHSWAHSYSIFFALRMPSLLNCFIKCRSSWFIRWVWCFVSKRWWDTRWAEVGRAPNIRSTHAMQYVKINFLSWCSFVLAAANKVFAQSEHMEKHDICFPFLCRVIRGFCHSRCRVELKAQ